MARYVRAYVGIPGTAGADVGSSAAYVYDIANQRFYGGGIGVTASGTNCQTTSQSGVNTGAASVATGDYSLYSERGTKVGDITVATAGTAPAKSDLGSDSHWRAVPSLLTQFGGIGILILSVLPIIVLVSYLGVAGMGLVEYGKGLSQGGIVQAVGGAVMSLIVYVVVLQILPTVIDAIIGGSQVTSGQYTVTSQFSGVMGIVFAAIPILLCVALLATSGLMTFSKAQSFRSNMGM